MVVLNFFFTEVKFRLKQPCKDCEAPYGFKNHMQLSTNTSRFSVSLTALNFVYFLTCPTPIHPFCSPIFPEVLDSNSVSTLRNLLKNNTIQIFFKTAFRELFLFNSCFCYYYLNIKICQELLIVIELLCN